VVVAREAGFACSPGALWRFVADTERLNRAIGLGPIEVAPLSSPGSARFLVQTHQAGLPLCYEEQPFEWIEGERFVVRRVVQRGMVRSIEHRVELSPREGGGSLCRVVVTVEPKVRLTAPLIRLTVGRFILRMLGELGAVDARLAAGERPRLGGGRPALESAELMRTAETLRALTPAQRAAADRLIDLVRTAPDSDIGRIRPFELADAWGLERREVLVVCLSAVIAGMLELIWDIVCPSCMTASGRVPTLAELGETGHCQLCDLSFGLELDRAVEATFRPARPVRRVDVGPYCIGGPGRTPHVFSQAVLPASGEASLRAPAEEGRYRLFVRGGATASVEVASAGAAQAQVQADGPVTPSALAIAPRGEIRVLQKDGPERHVKLERLDFASRAATAHEVSTVPAFRRLFAKDVLRPGTAMRIGRAALLFSDLTGATALYARVGDAVAFRVVQEHFDLLQEAIEAHQGTIIKTIGDAVMAAFVHESDAVRAAVAMHRSMPRFRARGPEPAMGMQLKLGLHAGPSYAVTANGILDYFGQTVNIASRLQGVAKGGEVVLALEFAERAAEGGWLGEASITERFEAQLKGIAEPLRAARVVVDILGQ
jgi:class 3 adenylate cyclase